MTAPFNYKTGNGKEIKILATIEFEVREIVYNSDGCEIKTGRMDAINHSYIDVYIDNNHFGKYLLTKWTLELSDNEEMQAKIIGALNLGFKYGSETIEAYEKWAEEVMQAYENAKTEEIVKIESRKETEENQKTIKEAEAIMAAAKTQKDIPPTEEEARAIMKNYNDIQNEGGEGYVPLVVSRESVEWAKNIVSTLK